MFLLSTKQNVKSIVDIIITPARVRYYSIKIIILPTIQKLKECNFNLSSNFQTIFIHQLFIIKQCNKFQNEFNELLILEIIVRAQSRV